MSHFKILSLIDNSNQLSYIFWNLQLQFQLYKLPSTGVDSKITLTFLYIATPPREDYVPLILLSLQHEELYKFTHLCQISPFTPIVLSF